MTLLLLQRRLNDHPLFCTYSSLTRTYTPLLCKYSIQLASSPFVFSTIPPARLPCPLLFSLTEGEPTGEICGKHIWVTHVRALIGGYCVGGWVPACFSTHVWVAYPCRQQQQASNMLLIPHSHKAASMLHNAPFAHLFLCSTHSLLMSFSCSARHDRFWPKSAGRVSCILGRCRLFEYSSRLRIGRAFISNARS